ncbi:Thiol-disulfide oxidoreductase ResA [compost metagenome]
MTPFIKNLIFNVLVFCLMPLWGFSQNTYHLRGQITANDGSRFFLNYKIKGKVVQKATVCKDNQFSIKGSLPEAVLCTLSNSLNKQIRIFIAENSDMTITGNVDQFVNAVIVNSTENELYAAFKEKSYALVSDYRKMVKDAGGDLKDTNSKASVVFHQRQDSLLFAIVRSNPNNMATAIMIYDLYVTRPDRVKASKYLDLLSAKVQQTYYGQKIAKFMVSAKNIVLGRPAPDFALRNPDGKIIRLADYKGRYVFLDFWASWCGPCRQENPSIVKCYEIYASDTLKFLGVSLDADAASWKTAIATDKLPWTQLNDPESTNGVVAGLYGIRAIPFNVLIDPAGKIIALNLRGDALEGKLKTIFK